jgi:DNA-3-methyladenine glycosylase II
VGNQPLILTPQSYQEGIAILVERDADLATVVGQWGIPPLWIRQPDFSTLIRLILEQQVSLASARATFNRLDALVSPLTPQRFLSLTEESLRAIGFSRQKSRYGRELALALSSGQLDLVTLAQLPDEDVRATLIAMPGIGPWTAEIYLLLALRRADAWPVNDLGVIVGLQQVKGLPQRPTRVEADLLAESWRPWRAIATRLLWFNYLKGESPI